MTAPPAPAGTTPCTCVRAGAVGAVVVADPTCPALAKGLHE